MEFIKPCILTLPFDSNEKLSLQFKQRTKHIKDFLCVHKNKTSQTEFMTNWLHCIQEENEEDFEDIAAEWKAKTTSIIFADFKKLFTDRNFAVHDRDK